MKKIIASLALSVLCLAVTVGSFLTNDVAAYRDWATQNNPRMMNKIDRQIQNFGSDKSSQKKQDKDNYRQDRHYDDHNDHRDKRQKDERHPDNRGDRSRFSPVPAPTPTPAPAPAPAPGQPAPSSNA